MLKPLIASFINLFFIDSILFNVVFAGVAFLFDWRFPGPEDGTLGQMHGSDYWIYWVQFAAGAVLSLVVRAATGRLRSIHIMLTPSERAGLSYQGWLVAAMAFLGMFLYRLRIRDPGDALVEPFAIGIVISLLWVWMVLMLAELIGFMMGSTDKTSVSGELVTLTFATSRNVTAAVVVALLMGLDLLAFEHGHWLVLLMVGGLAAVWAASVVLARVPQLLKAQ